MLVSGRGIEDSIATPKSRGFEDLNSRLAAGIGLEDSLIATSRNSIGSEDLNRSLVTGRGIEDILVTPKSRDFEDLNSRLLATSIK